VKFQIGKCVHLKKQSDFSSEKIILLRAYCVSSKPGHLSVLYIQRMNIIIVDFIKIRSKNSVNKANL